MRIVVDLQACQTEGSHNRGIGRYSLALAKAMARLKGKHELRFVLNDLYQDAVEDVIKQLNDFVPSAMVSYYQYLDSGHICGLPGDYNRQVAETLIRHHYAQLRPDILHISSVFEGCGGKAVVPGRLWALPGMLCSATLYDLIPLIMSDIYLPTETLKTWYHQKLRIIKECDLLLAISEASRQDAINYLGISPEKIVNISGAADAAFQCVHISPELARNFLQRYGIKGKFILYTGGVDYRKNVEGAISGYARLSAELRRQYHLVVVCTMHPHQKSALLEHAAREGLADGEVLLTGFVQEKDLVLLYNLCTAFIFPSLYEGFGLPILEAMYCGAPVLGADNSSIPEIIGRRDALFDGHNPETIAAALYRALTDEGYRDSLKAWSRDRAKAFSWECSASKALDAFEEARERSRPRDAMIPARYLPRRKMAYFSPCRGIMDSTELLANLSRYYSIDIFSDVLSEEDGDRIDNYTIFSYREYDDLSDNYEIVLYDLGNSPHHTYMYDILQHYPGIIVLHEFYIGEMLHYIESKDPAREGLLATEAEYSHGRGVKQFINQPGGRERVITEYPCNRRVLDGAAGIIVHSRTMLELVKEFYPQGIAAPLEYIDLEHHPEQIAAQYALAMEKNMRQFNAQQLSVLAAELGEILAPHGLSGKELASVAECAIANMPAFQPPRILVDVSLSLQADLCGGIPRTVRSITRQLCHTTRRDCQALPIGLLKGKLYQSEQILQSGKSLISVMPETEVCLKRHDILLMLDTPWIYFDDFKEIFKRIRRQRGRIYTVVYDLIPILNLSYHDSLFADWLGSVVQESDGLICISRTVADELIAYIQEKELVHKNNLKVGYFHLGADIQANPAEAVVRPDVVKLFNGRNCNIFLMVGAIIPRKGHAFALDAFDKLWTSGVDIKLVIAGKNLVYGELVNRLLFHAEYGKRLLWVDNPTDAELIYCYRHATALLFPSAAEGFGLPLIEAARYGLPVICSDIPVFREVAGEYATYVSLAEPQCLVELLHDWPPKPAHPVSTPMPRLSWQQSADHLLNIIINNNWYKILP